jgi:hypothetical protein
MSVAEGTAWASSTKIAWGLVLVQETFWYWLAPQPDTARAPAATASTTAIDLQALAAPARGLAAFMRRPPSCG